MMSKAPISLINKSIDTSHRLKLAHTEILRGLNFKHKY